MPSQEQNTDFVKLAIISLMLSISITILMSFYTYSALNRVAGTSTWQESSDTIWAQTMINADFIVEQNTVTTEKEDVSATAGASPNLITDIISTLVKLANAVVFIIEVVGMTLLCPVVIGDTILPLITNNFVAFIITIFLALWGIIQSWLIWRLFITKRG